VARPAALRPTSEFGRNPFLFCDFFFSGFSIAQWRTRSGFIALFFFFSLPPLLFLLQF